MQIGAMNHPAADIVTEIRWMAEMGLEFVDLTLEPPAAAAWKVDAKAIRRALDDHGMGVVGHTAYYLPMASAFDTIRRAAVEEFRRCLDKFAEVGARWMNLHPDRHTPMHDRSFYIRRNLESLAEMQEHASKVGVGLMIENLPGDYNNAWQLGQLLEPMPELGLHLDIGHANLLVPHNTTSEILEAWGKRLRHVHLHDNRGGHDDLHLPLGTGNLDLYGTVGSLKKCGFDGTITLEVFSKDRHYLSYSRDVLRTVWESIEAPGQQHPVKILAAV
ncbi:MAG TPA: sugar phosphate isomerase/epimerase family protein [Bryobacteraceae bacterium]|nr:sugar phosphate isomerase/epimerase family protein [Bryobacteraceae bacterium]